MNPLQEYPELFANGKFRVRWFFKDEPYDDYLIEGYTLDEGGALMIEGTDGSKHDYIFPTSEKMKLIARPIEDMSDEECTESVLFDCIKDKAEPIYIRKELVKMNSLVRTMRLSLYLLSIGVYPFDQSHFGDTVIDIRTLNE